MKLKILIKLALGICISLLFTAMGQAQNCACWQIRDTTFRPVPFTSGTAPLYRNDDGSTNAITLPFTFCYGGRSIDSLYINNNGNITIGTPLPNYTSDTFPQPLSVMPAMIAPFWADVDTRSSLATNWDLVYYQITPTHLIVQWDSVGYYSGHTNELNSFQLIISNGTDSIIPSGNNVEFCYGNMAWTTGDASAGTGGFGGYPATVGFNFGDGVNFLQFGLFDIAGSAYYGQFPASPNYDGVGWLSNNMFYYNTCGLPLPPMVSGISPCDTMILYSNDTIYFHMLFLTSFQPDTVIANPVSALPSGLSVIANIPGHIDSIYFKAVGPLATLGYHTVKFYGYDKNNLNDTGYGSFVLHVIEPVTTSSQSMQNDNVINVYPNPNNGIFHIASNISDPHTSIEVYDLLGKQVLYTPLNQLQSDNVIDMRSQPNGIYFYRILSDFTKQISEGKFVIQK